MSEATVRRTEVRKPGLVGTVYESAGQALGFVVVLSGSGGGVPDGYAERLAGHGLTSFALAYFGAPGLPVALVEIPIEGLRSGIEYFRDRWSGGRPVAVMGSSKGAELALILGAHLHDGVDRVVAIAPACVAWYGLDQTDPSSADRSSWTWGGQPVRFLPHVHDVQPLYGSDGMRVDVCYDLSRYDAREVEAAAIPVEQCREPILLLSGGDDHMWPAASFADRVVERMRRHGRASDVTNVVYRGAGHAFLHREFFANRDAHGRPIWDFGGNDADHSAAAADAWPRIASFLAGDSQ
jgi:dienelactone hydrolase